MQIVTIRTKSNSNPSNEIRRKGLEAFECKFEIFERDSMHSNPSTNHLKGIRSIRMQVRKGFEAFESKFELFERDSKHSNANSNHSKGIRVQILTI